jgi:hypothetical protein
MSVHNSAPVARIVHPTNASVAPPLLIEEGQLLALDKVLDDFIEDREDRSTERTKRSVILYLSAGRTVKSTRFGDAIKQPNIGTEEPLGFRVQLEFGRMKATISLTKLVRNVVQPTSPTQFQVVQESQKLDFSVEPSDHQAAPELFGLIENWATDLAPSAMMRNWVKYRPGFVILLVCWLFCGWLYPHVNTKGTVADQYRDEAARILNDGITEKNERRALEMVLAIQADIPPPPGHISWRPTRAYWGRYGLGAVILLVLSCSPTVVIGVWKGKATLRAWHRWNRFVLFSVPGTMFLTLIWPKIIGLLGF